MIEEQNYDYSVCVRFNDDADTLELQHVDSIREIGSFVVIARDIAPHETWLPTKDVSSLTVEYVGDQS